MWVESSSNYLFMVLIKTQKNKSWVFLPVMIPVPRKKDEREAHRLSSCLKVKEIWVDTNQDTLIHTVATTPKISVDQKWKYLFSAYGYH